jgi:ABC-type transport system involved in multi-copper enzyme maturation permease subunit
VNKSILRALLLDAYYQVLDNMVFRILAVLVCVLVLPAFLIGFRPEGIVILWGVKTIGYQEFASWFGQHLPTDAKDVDLAFIQGLQQLVVGSFAGNIGIFFSLAATAFFVPRMLEKGAADVVFSRPIGRATLLAARYFAGVLFIVLLGTVLVLGMHVGLLLVSGKSDPAFLWSILTLAYVFALVHAVSTVVAVFSRSSVAAILTALLFFSANGCVHKFWIPLEWARARSAVEREEALASGGEVKPEVDAGALGFFAGVLDILHFTLPKTTDADVIVAKLRTLVSGERVLLRDPPGFLVVHAPPSSYTLAPAAEQTDLAREPARWTWDGGPAGQATLLLRRESRLVEKPGEKTRKRAAAEYSRELATSLKSQAGTSALERSKLPDLRTEIEYDAWSETLDGKKTQRGRGFFGTGDWIYVLELESESAATPGELVRDRFRELSESFLIDRDDPRYMDPQTWYTRRLDWTAPPRHNIFVSIASSLAFALLLFALAVWKLRRIDF